MKYFTKEVQIALVAIAGIVMLFFGLKFLKGMSFYSDDNTYYATFKDMNGVTTSTPVYANGYKVGVVKEVSFDYSNGGSNVVMLGLDKQLSLPKGSKVEISSDVLGNLKLNLVLGTNPIDLMEAGDTLRGGVEDGAMAKVAGMVPQVEKMMPKIDSILHSLNTLLSDPALRSALHNINNTTGQLNTASTQLNTLMASLNHNVPVIMTKANGVMTHTEKLTNNLSAIDVAGTMAKVDATLDNVHQMTEKLNSNDGTLGLLMRDAQLYNNLNATARNADSLVNDLKQHPKRYVHFSIFGKKDK